MYAAILKCLGGFLKIILQIIRITYSEQVGILYVSKILLTYSIHYL